MSVLLALRRAGLGRRLGEAAMAAAHLGGIERIELERYGRKLDGVYDANVLMALVQRTNEW